MGLGIKRKIKSFFDFLRTNCLYGSRKNVFIGRKAVIEGKIEINSNGKVEIGQGTIIRRWVCLKPWGGSIKIGENCTINSFCHISGNGGVVIGDNVLIATQCVIVSANHNFNDPELLIREQSETRKGITIEENCWLGAGVKVLDGVTIGYGSVIGAGSVVTKNVPPNSICIGVPAKVIKSRS